jgi:hypothetical protein
LERFFAEDNTEDSGNMKRCFVLCYPSTNQIGFRTMKTKDFRQLWTVGGQFKFHFPLPRTTSGIFIRNCRALTHGEFASDLVVPLPPNHISSRAWVFQERLLSTRVVNYTSAEIVLECITAVDCQCNLVKIYYKELPRDDFVFDSNSELNFDLNPEDAPGFSAKSEGSTQTLKLFFESQILDETMSSEGLLLVWSNVVFHYSALQLSNPNDRLPALSGLAKRFRVKELLGQYVAGLWTEHLDRMLCWSTPANLAPGTRPAGYIAPTWSWASIRDGVYFSNLWEEKAGILSAYSTIVGSVKDVAVVRAGADPTGAVSDGYLTLSGQLIEAKLLVLPYDPNRRSTQRGLPSELDLDSESESSGSDSDASTNYYRESRHPYEYRIIREGIDLRQPFVPDSISELDILTKEHTVTLLLWTLRDCPWTTTNKTAFSCFVLLPHPYQDERYTRLGLLQYYELNREEHTPAKKWFGDAPTRSVSCTFSEDFYPSSFHFRFRLCHKPWTYYFWKPLKELC